MYVPDPLRAIKRVWLRDILATLHSNALPALRWRFLKGYKALISAGNEL